MAAPPSQPTTTTHLRYRPGCKQPWPSTQYPRLCKTLRCHRRLGGCGRLARAAEPIEAFLEAAVFEMVRRPAFSQFLAQRSKLPDERAKLVDQIRIVETLQHENLVAYAAPEPGSRRRSKAEYELVAARLDAQLDLLNRRIRALSTSELPMALIDGDLENEWPTLPFYARRRILETLLVQVKLLPGWARLSTIRSSDTED